MNHKENNMSDCNTLKDGKKLTKTIELLVMNGRPSKKKLIK